MSECHETMSKQRQQGIAKKEHDWDAQSEKYLKVYEKVIDQSAYPAMVK